MAEAGDEQAMHHKQGCALFWKFLIPVATLEENATKDDQLFFFYEPEARLLNESMHSSGISCAHFVRK